MKRLFIVLSLMLVILSTLMAEQITVSPNQNDVRLISSNPNHSVMELTLGHFTREAVSIDGNTWYNLNLKKEGLTLEAGLPQLPIISRSVIIPDMARMDMSIVNSEYVDVTMPIAPSKGNLTRDIDPSTVAYTFGSFYNTDASYPEQLAVNTEPFIIRDYRGMTVKFQPFVYFPATQTLRVYTRIRVELTANGTDMTNAFTTPKSSYSAEYAGIYNGMFLNFADAKYPNMQESGRMLVITHSMFANTILPWVEWKRQKGMQVDVVDVATIGSSSTQISAYIASQYNLNNGLMYVQLVGDAPQIPTLSSGGGGADPSYTLIAGNDNYPEIFIGRFSATTVAELQTQVDRSIYYERDIQVGNPWIQKATGIASNEGGGSQGDMGESDQVHEDLIRTDLLNYGYTTVDQIYQATGASIAQINTSINAGRGFLNYTGHGSDTTWGTTGFSNTNANALVNDNKLPFIVSVACVNGNFVSMTCFAEAWMRSINETTNAPAGALVFWGSSINQSWNPPMRAQDEVTDLLIAEQKQTIGGLFTNGASKMIETYATDGANMHKTWIIFGDASLMVRTKDPVALTTNYNSIMFLGSSTFEVNTDPGAVVAITANGTLYGKAVANASGLATVNIATPPDQPMDLTITITCFNKVTHVGTIQVLPSDGPYVVVDNMTVVDGNDNSPATGEMIDLSFSLNNVGAFNAENVSVLVTSTDQYLTINMDSIPVGNINANGTLDINTGISATISSNVPDQHVAQIDITITADGDNVWSYNRSITINAPSFAWGQLEVTEMTGNGNNRIDAGETVVIAFPLTNVGHADASDVIGTILINGVQHIIDPVVTTFLSLPANDTMSFMFAVTFSSQIPVGTPVSLMVILSSGQYSSINTYNTIIGLVAEDFESGSFQSYPWTFSGTSWTIDTTDPHAGMRSAKSATITHSQTTSMTVIMAVPAVGNITFWKKVSSESSYDYLKFYINNSLQSQWSGTVAWSQETFSVAPGNNTFRWEYSKDSGVSSGSDCVWIDDIVFPSVGGTTGAPSISIATTNMDFGPVFVGESNTLPLEISNTGDAVLIGTLQVSAPYYIIPMDSDPVTMMNYLVSPNSNLEITIGFIPDAPGTFNSEMIITSDDADNTVLTIPLLGTATTVANNDQIAPVVTALKGNYPNPFNPTTTISYSVKTAGPVQLDIYNILGQKVKTLVNDNVPAGNHSVTWNGKDANNRNVASGIYFYRMKAGKYTSTKKMIMMK